MFVFSTIRMPTSFFKVHKEYLTQQMQNARYTIEEMFMEHIFTLKTAIEDIWGGNHSWLLFINIAASIIH